LKYDDASWHYGGEFPKDLPHEAGATHIGMYVAWCALNGMVGELMAGDFADDLEQLRKREVTPGAWFLNTCDGKFTNEELNDEGNAFTTDYYAEELATFVVHYEETLGQGRPSIYHVPDTWQSYDLLAPVISQQYQAWKQLGH